VWRLREHRLPVGVTGVTVADRVADLHVFAAVVEFLCDAVQRDLKIPVDVIGERLERRDVQAVDGVFEPLGAVSSEQFVDDAGEAGERIVEVESSRTTDEVVSIRNGEVDYVPLVPDCLYG